MNRVVFPFLAIASVALAATLFAGDAPSWSSVGSSPGTPVVVELFTSEGCSSCPPADALLQEFDTQPFPGAQLIVLSEHVDYWNYIGWADPYSASAYSERQSAYVNHLHLDSAYTPQMIVDGTDEFVGSSSRNAQNAFDKAVATPKIPVQISNVNVEGNFLKAHLETGKLPVQSRTADVVFVVALNHAESQVARGENSGRRLTHVAVVRSLVKAGSVEAGHSFSGDVAASVEKGIDPSKVRIIAFLQEPGPGRILGAAVERLAK
jgi:hypothetical protein